MTVDIRFATSADIYCMRNVAVRIKLEDQRKAEEAYREWLRRAIADFRRIHWPIAFIDKGYDVPDFEDTLLKTLENPWPEERLREMAEEIVDHG